MVAESPEQFVPLPSAVHRTGRGSLRGQLILPLSWDSDEVNEEISCDFGMTAT